MSEKKKEQKKTARHETLFHCVAPKAEKIFLAGTFNDWNPSAAPMARDPGGTWSLFLDLPSGTYEYKFVVDGQWCCVPGAESEFQGCPDCVTNPFGTMNHVVHVE